MGYKFEGKKKEAVRSGGENFPDWGGGHMGRGFLFCVICVSFLPCLYQKDPPPHPHQRKNLPSHPILSFFSFYPFSALDISPSYISTGQRTFAENSQPEPYTHTPPGTLFPWFFSPIYLYTIFFFFFGGGGDLFL